MESPTELEEVRQMPTVSRKLAVVAGLALAAGTLGSGVALAGSSNQAPPARSAVKSAPAVAGSATSFAARPATVVKAVAPKTARSQSEDPSAVDTDNIQEGDQTTPDAAATASASESGSEGTESATESDGPGGHADPAGNVDHQFEGEE
ncbi:MAG: hypothetical protein ACR2JO_01835 [Mycobacteriales bacterium]